MSASPRFCVYGAPLADLAPVPAGAVQTSPLVPGSEDLESLAPGSVDAFVMSAPPGTIERRAALALALRALRPGAALTAMAPKDKGGSRLGKELAGFGCEVAERGQRHQRICVTQAGCGLVGLEAAIAAGAPRFAPGPGLWTQPGLFSWDRIDQGSALLIEALPALAGHGADLGCGAGALARAVLAEHGVTRLELVDLDRRAIAAAGRNVVDPRAVLHWADARRPQPFGELDFVVTNPPFHDGGAEDRALGQAFVARARDLLRPGGSLWLVANRHLPYEAPLASLFGKATLKLERGGYKVYEAVR